MIGQMTSFEDALEASVEANVTSEEDAAVAEETAQSVSDQLRSATESLADKVLVGLASGDGAEANETVEVVLTSTNLNMTVQARPVAFDEVLSFREVGACGTATVLAPISGITDGDVRHEFGGFDQLDSFRTKLQQIQYGEAEDKHGWMRVVEC